MSFPDDGKILVSMQDLPNPFEFWPWVPGDKPLTREEVRFLNSKIEKIIRKEQFQKEQLLVDIKHALERIGK